MKACLLACFCRVAKLKAFRQVRKTASRVRKGITGKSSKQALEEARKIQAELKRRKVEAKQEHNVKHDYEESFQQKLLQQPSNHTAAPEEKLIAAVGARRKEWQMVYSHLYITGIGLGDLVDRLLQCGITLADYHSLAIEVHITMLCSAIYLIRAWRFCSFEKIRLTFLLLILTG